MLIYKILNSYEKQNFYLNNGKHSRDFTYIGDVVLIIFKLIKNLKNKNDIFNISIKKINLLKLINLMSLNGKIIKIKNRKFQGDIKDAWEVIQKSKKQ